jgi:FkbM family methyltransferase
MLKRQYLDKILGAAASRAISFLGHFGIGVPHRNLLNVLARQYDDIASLEAFDSLIYLLQSISLAGRYTLLIPDDMYKALTFIKHHIHNPVIMCVSNSKELSTSPDCFFLKKSFIFKVYHILKKYEKQLYLHFENVDWIILADGIIHGGTSFSASSYHSIFSEASKDRIYGYKNSVLSVRPGTNDYQIVHEVASTYLPEIQKWQEEENMQGKLRILDLGGHIGSFSIQINALLHGNCEIHIYEPEKSNFCLIKKNIALNNSTNIHAFNKAVSSAVGSTMLYINREHSGAHQLGTKLSYKTEAIPVEVTTFESVFAEWGDNQGIDILKIDVEGSEYDVLFPAEELVKQCRIIVGEAQKSKDYIPQDLLEFLQDIGFSVQHNGCVTSLLTFCAVNRQGACIL